MQNFTIEITRERGSKKWWRVDVPLNAHPELLAEYDHWRTQALSRADARAMAQDLISLWLDVEPGRIHIGRVTYRYRHLD